MTGIIDYGAGNLFSIAGGVRAAGGEARVCGEISELKKCDELILPGVGAFRPAMERLAAKRLEAGEEPLSYLTLLPLYLRAPQAERERAAREAAKHE